MIQPASRYAALKKGNRNFDFSDVSEKLIMSIGSLFHAQLNVVNVNIIRIIAGMARACTDKLAAPLNMKSRLRINSSGNAIIKAKGR